MSVSKGWKSWTVYKSEEIIKILECRSINDGWIESDEHKNKQSKQNKSRSIDLNDLCLLLLLYRDSWTFQWIFDVISFLKTIKLYRARVPSPKPYAHLYFIRDMSVRYSKWMLCNVFVLTWCYSWCYCWNLNYSFN